MTATFLTLKMFWASYLTLQEHDKKSLLPLLILSFLGFRDMTSSWFSPTSSQSPLSVHPYLVVTTYQNS